MMATSKKVLDLISLIATTGKSDFGMYDATQKAVYHKDNFSAFLEGRFGEVKPVTMEVVPSLECNFNCPNCTYKQNGSKSKPSDDPRFLTMDMAKRVLEGCKGLMVKSLIFTGGGEPFKNPSTIRYIAMALSMGFEVGVYTNGALLDPAMISALLALEPTFIRVSHNAGMVSTHQAQYGYSCQGNGEVNFFEKVIENTALLAKLKKERKIGTTIGVGVILNELNIPDIDVMADNMLQIQWSSRGGLDYIAFRPEVSYFDGPNVYTGPQNPGRETLFAFVKDDLENRILPRLESAGVRTLIASDAFESLSQPYVNVPNIATPWSASFDYDGKLHLSSEQNGMPQFCIGDLANRSLKDIWDGSERTRLRSLAETGADLSLPNYKLRSLNDLLHKVKAIGRFTKDEVEEFYGLISLDRPPEHVNFI